MGKLKSDESKEFTLERRYGVFKISDMRSALGPPEIQILEDLLSKVDKWRLQNSKDHLSGVFVEEDWPIYGKVVDLIKGTSIEVGGIHSREKKWPISEFHICGCGEGYASKVDDLCRFCREKKYSRSQCKSVGVRHRGDGLSFEQEARINKADADPL